MLALPLALLLMSRGILANQAPLGARNTKCFSSTVSGKSSYNACCSGAQEGISEITNADDASSQAFHYSCASYVSNYDDIIEPVYSARACAEACAASSSCHAGSWDSNSLVCLTASTTDAEFVSDSEKTFMRFVKVDESNIPPSEAIECDDQVVNAKLSCKNEQEKKCNAQLETQKEDLSSQCEQRVEDQCKLSDGAGDAAEQCKKQKSKLQESLQLECEVEKDNAAKQWEKDQAAKDAQNREARADLEAKVKQLQQQEADNKKRTDEEKKTLDKLQKENKELQKRIDEGSSNTKPQPPPASKPSAKPSSPKPSSKPSDKNTVYDVPSLSKFSKKCSDMEGQEYTVLGVTYKVFCGMHPDDGVAVKREWRAKDPSFLMGMCSTTPGCQGVKLRENFAQLSPKHDFPPSERVEQKYWSLVPKTQHAESDVLDIRSQFLDDNDSVRCPEVDGQIITLGDSSYQLNCNRKFIAQKQRTATGVNTFNECLVSCSVTRGCNGIMHGNYCSLIFSHHVLPRETPEEDQSKGEKWVALLTEA